MNDERMFGVPDRPRGDGSIPPGANPFLSGSFAPPPAEPSAPSPVPAAPARAADGAARTPAPAAASAPRIGAGEPPAPVTGPVPGRSAPAATAAPAARRPRGRNGLPAFPRLDPATLPGAAPAAPAAPSERPVRAEPPRPAPSGVPSRADEPSRPAPSAPAGAPLGEPMPPAAPPAASSAAPAPAPAPAPARAPEAAPVSAPVAPATAPAPIAEAPPAPADPFAPALGPGLAPAEPPAPRREPMPEWTLVLADGVSVPVYGAVVVGRNPKPAEPTGTVAVSIDDPTRTMSKTHARLWVEHGVLFIDDLGSTNGVALLAGGSVEHATALDPGAPVEVRAGDIVQLGEYRIGIRRS